QAVGTAVGVAVQLAGAALDRLARLRQRAEGALVRRQLDDALEPELALDLLDRLARLVRDEIVEGRLEEAVRDLRNPAHGADSSAQVSKAGFCWIRKRRERPRLARRPPALPDPARLDRRSSR